MNSVDLTKNGGLPFVQNSLAFLQSAWQEIFLGLGKALNITGTSNDVILLSGCEQSLSSGILTINQGWAIWRTETSPVISSGEIFYIPSISIPFQNPPAALYFELNDDATPPLDPTYMKLTGTVYNLYRTKRIKVTYTPNVTKPHILLSDVKQFKDMLRSYSTPIGMIAQFAGTTIPYGWELCDGSVKNASANPAYSILYATIGTSFGTGGVAGDFKVPDLRDKFVLGASTTNPIGTLGGDSTATLLEANLPPHKHSINTDGSHTHSLTNANNIMMQGPGSPHHNTGSSSVDMHEVAIGSDLAGDHSHGGGTGDGNGNSTPINIMPPYIALAYIIRAF